MDALRSLPGHSLEHRELLPTSPATRGARQSPATISKESLTVSPLLLHLLQVVSGRCEAYRVTMMASDKILFDVYQGFSHYCSCPVAQLDIIYVNKSFSATNMVNPAHPPLP